MPRSVAASRRRSAASLVWSGLTGAAPLLVGPPHPGGPGGTVLPLVAVVAGLVEPLAVLLGGPAVCPPVLLHRVGRHALFGDRAHRGTVPQRLSHDLLQLLLRPPDTVQGSADSRGVGSGDRSRIGHASRLGPRGSCHLLT